jgi:hypothetical protein
MECDSMKPACQRVGFVNLGGSSKEDYESGLEGVLGVFVIPKGSSANAIDHRAVPTNDFVECAFFVSRHDGR